MRIARKTLLSAFAALAFAANTASAQETEVEVWDEHANEPCGFVVDAAGCAIHMVGESHIVALPTGLTFLKCQDEFEGVLQTDGTGEVEWNGVNHPGGGIGCNALNCLNQLPNEHHLALHSAGELGGEVEHLTLRMCLEGGPGTTDVHCNLEVDLVDTEEQAHDYTLSTAQLCAGGARRWEGAWTFESEDIHNEIELVHHE